MILIGCNINTLNGDIRALPLALTLTMALYLVLALRGVDLDSARSLIHLTSVLQLPMRPIMVHTRSATLGIM